MEIEVTGHQLAHPANVKEMPDLEFLRDEKLNRSATFRDLRSQVEKHFQQSHTMHPEKSPKWKSVLYTSLLTSLREVAFTPDSEERMEMLKDVHKWYRSKTNRPSVSVPHAGQKSGVAFKSAFSILDKPLNNAHVLKPIETKSVSPIRQARPAIPQIPSNCDISYPFAKPVTMLPLNETAVMQRLCDYQQRKLKELRSAVLKKKQLTDWGKYRSRVEENSMLVVEHKKELPGNLSELVSDKNQTPSPLLVDLRNNSRSVTPSSVTVESDRVSRVRQKHAELLNVSEESPARRSTAASLSFYSRFHQESSIEIRRPQTPSHAPFPPGSDSKPTQHSSLNPLRRLKIEEMHEVKRRMALANLPCTYRVLKQGLLEPDDLPPAKLTPDSLPQGGELLQSNPFFSLGKKPKKLKRRR